MAVFKRGDTEIYYEEHGSGFPLLIFAPGGLRSELSFWRHSPSNPAASAPWMDPMTALADKYRVVAMDQRNAGRSKAPVRPEDGWNEFAQDHLALADHLGLDRFHTMGGCIGASFCLKLCEIAPQRVASAVLQNPIGHDDNRAVFKGLVDLWAKGIKAVRSDIDDATIAALSRNMFGNDFVFSVTREFVRGCDIPMLVMPGDDAPHPKAIGEELARLAPKIEALREWKGPAHLAAATHAVRAFLERNTPPRM